MKRRKNIFVLGLDDFNHRLMQSAPHEEEYVFHNLLTMEEVLTDPTYNVPQLLSKANSRLKNFSGSVDAIVSYWDFPAIFLLPILRQDWQLKGPSLTSVLKCEHKYWSRLEQQKVIPQHIPAFSLIDVFDDNAAKNPQCPMPFWMKPIKAHSSLLGFRIENTEQLARAIQKTRADINRFSQPLIEILQYACADLPESVKKANGCCIAESIITADQQCTLEGYVDGDAIEIYGVVDSIRGSNQSSFEAYEYPSRLSEDVQQRMKTLATKVIRQVGLHNSPFNIEFFYDPVRDRISLLEINARISQSHMPLFQKVDGVANSEVMIDLALGKTPVFPSGQGKFRCAAKFMPRIYDVNGETQIIKVPDRKTIRAIEQDLPGTEIKLEIKEGMQLAELMFQDSYSYQWATIYMGADSHEQLIDKYHRCLRQLDIKWSEQHASQL